MPGRTGPGTSSALGVIPVRYESSRFPGKPLAKVGGITLLQHVYERTRKAELLSEVVIATCDEVIIEEADRFGAPVVMTSEYHACGSDRVAEVARGRDAEIVVNIQGDEALIEPEVLDRCVAALSDATSFDIVTPAAPYDGREDLRDSNVVKVVMSVTGEALYFSRSPVPWSADLRTPGETPGQADAGTSPPRGNYLTHVGVYAFRKESLLRFADLGVSNLERSEHLEQLRALEHGMRMMVVVVPSTSMAVHTPKDLAELNRRLASLTAKA